MAEINLLPKKLVPTGFTERLIKRLKVFNLLATGVLLISLLVIIGYFLILTQSLQNTNTHISELKKSLVALKQTEHQYILVKNRAEVISQVLGVENISDVFLSFQNLVTTIPIDSFLNSAQLNKKTISFSYDFADSKVVADAIEKFLNESVFTVVSLDSFSFGKSGSYQANITLSK